MENISNIVIDHVWPKISTLDHLRTPDNLRGEEFFVLDVENDFVKVRVGAESIIDIQRSAFIEALRYLKKNGHDALNRCEIRSSNAHASAGPLCRATREVNGDVRVITYIVPILAAVGVIGFNGERPNSVWVI